MLTELRGIRSSPARRGARAVYAVDIEPLAVRYIQETAALNAPSFGNIKPVLSQPNATTIPGGSADVVLLCGVHYLNYAYPPDAQPADPVQHCYDRARPLLDDLRGVLRPGGKLAIIEQTSEWNPDQSVLDTTGLRELLARSGWAHVASHPGVVDGNCFEVFSP